MFTSTERVHAPALESLYPVSLVSSLLGERIVEAMRQKPQCVAREARERELKSLNGRVHAVSLLVANLVIQTIAALQANNYQALDANPGDMGCQNRAIAIHNLYKQGLPTTEELERLNQVALRVKQCVQDRKGGAKVPDNRLPDTFFEQELQSLNISREMEYALHCFLSKMMVQTYDVLPDGRTKEKSNVNQLSKFSSHINNVLDSRLTASVLENNQANLSYLSLEAVRNEAAQIHTLLQEEKDLMELMLSPEHTHLYTPNAAYAPKTFGCHFYEVKTLLSRLRETGGVVCVKSIVPKGEKPVSLFFKSEELGEDFTPISEEDIMPLDPVVVFEAVFHVDPSTLRDGLMEHGFTDVILSLAAKDDPYEHGSSLDSIEVPMALQEVSDYRTRGESISFLTIDHVYFAVKK